MCVLVVSACVSPCSDILCHQSVTCQPFFRCVCHTLLSQSESGVPYLGWASASPPFSGLGLGGGRSTVALKFHFSRRRYATQNHKLRLASLLRAALGSSRG